MVYGIVKNQNVDVNERLEHPAYPPN